jgi:two-component system OmpR family response regulator
MKILIIEDDREVASFIEKGFKDLNHQIKLSFKGNDGLQKATSEKFDVIITDRMLPEIEGLTIIKTLRNSGNLTPILILSTLGDVDDRVKGLRSGSDDYLVKPFSFAELLARVEALYRRNNQSGLDPQTILKADDLEVNLLSREVTRAGKKIDLQQREFKLLEYLLKNKGQVVTRAMLLENVWDYNFDPQTNIIDVHISRLRNKIDSGFEKPILKTVRGAGFCIEDK